MLPFHGRGRFLIPDFLDVSQSLFMYSLSFSAVKISAETKEQTCYSSRRPSSPLSAKHWGSSDSILVLGARHFAMFSIWQ